MDSRQRNRDRVVARPELSIADIRADVLEPDSDDSGDHRDKPGRRRHKRGELRKSRPVDYVSRLHLRPLATGLATRTIPTPMGGAEGCRT